MKSIRTIAAALAFAAIATLTANAQTARPAAPTQAAGGGAIPAETKFAIVDTRAFQDPKTGVQRLISVFNAVDREFKPRRDELVGLRTRYEQIAKDIEATKAVADEKTLIAKAEQADTLKSDIERKQQDGQKALDKRIQELTAPVYQDISTALQAFAKARGITVLFDAAKMEGAMFVVNDGIDVTDAFIKDYNSRNPATASVATPGARP